MGPVGAGGAVHAQVMVHPAQRQCFAAREKCSLQRSGFATGIAPPDRGEAGDPVSARLFVHVVMTALPRRCAGKHEQLGAAGDGLGRALGVCCR